MKKIVIVVVLVNMHFMYMAVNLIVNLLKNVIIQLMNIIKRSKKTMLITKYIDTLLKRRTRLAKQLDEVCQKVDDWLDKNGIEPDSACYHTGVETYVNPDRSEDEVRRTILAKESKKRRE